MITEKFNKIFRFGPKSKIKAGDGLNEGRFPFYTSSSILKKFVNTEQYFDEALIFGTGGSASVHYANEPFSTSTDCIVAITQDKNLNTKFVYYYLYGNLHILERGFRGAGLKHISKKYIQNLDVPILPIETQNKIVALLDKASSLIQKRENSIVQLDELLRAQFLDMFGEAPTNAKKWESNELGKFLDFMTSGSRGWAKYYRDTGDKFLRINNLGYNDLNLDELKFIETPNTAEAKRTKIQPKDVLLSITADLGRTAVVPDDIGNAFINQHIALLRFNDEFNPYFISAYISSIGGRHLLERYNKGAAKSGLNFSDIKSLNVHIPPIELQNQFETIYHNIQAQKETLNQSKTELENLFNSLLQRAFNGQLNFNVDAELDVLLAAIDLEQDTEKEKHDIKEIATVYIGRLLERIEEQDFENQMQYQQAKEVVFQMLKEGGIIQEYNEKEEAVKLKLV